MTDSEKLNLILAKISTVEQRTTNIEQRITNIEQRITNIELHIENTTDKNIQLIAENFVELTNKLNQAIPAADKNLAYEIKVNYLVSEIEKLKLQIAELKNKIA